MTLNEGELGVFYYKNHLLILLWDDRNLISPEIVFFTENLVMRVGTRKQDHIYRHTYQVKWPLL